MVCGKVRDSVMAEPSADFLDVPRLLERSVPQARPAWVWYAMLSLAVFAMTTTWTGEKNPQVRGAVQLMGGVAMLAIVGGMGWFASYVVALQRKEQQRVEAIEELVQLRRWDQAAAMLDAMLSQPTRTPSARLQALIYLANVLARYHRFADAIAVQDYLLANAQLDPNTAHGLRLMRTMAMLHEDRLFDVDRAIGELRRESADSAGLALIEMYRDIKTGHPEEAIGIFQARGPAMRAQLGVRIADAHAIVARAHDLMGQEAEAAAAYERATLLAPPEELCRRYPEVA